MLKGSSPNSWDLEWTGSSQVTYSILTCDDLLGTWTVAASGISGAALNNYTLSDPRPTFYVRVVQE